MTIIAPGAHAFYSWNIEVVRKINYFSFAALHLLVRAAGASHRRHLLPAGGGRDREGLRRVPRPPGKDRQA